MCKKIIYISLLILFTSLFCCWIINPKAIQINYKNDISTQKLLIKKTSEPKRMFLNTWRIVKTNYYETNLNNQNWNKWKDRYLKQIKTPEDAKLAIESMLASLNEPYSRFLDEEEFAEQMTGIDSKITGIGINIMTYSGNTYIVNVLEDTPASHAILKSGDKIVKIDGKDVIGLPLNTVAKLIRGDIGTQVCLQILRDNKKITKYITRQQINIKEVTYKIIDKNIGYIDISSFLGADMVEEFKLALDKTKHTKGLIIDLRGNTGGLLPNAIILANMFIQPNNLIVNIVERNGKKTKIQSETIDYSISKPTVILINNETASASEILSGALQDNKRAILIGEKTFGKGKIQKIFPLPNNCAINLTIAKYLTPNGSNIDNIGIKPDIYVKYTKQDFLHNKDPQLNMAKITIKKISH